MWLTTAAQKIIDGVIWTDLRNTYEWNDQTLGKIKAYIKSTDRKKREIIKEYITNTPRQIKTEFRFQLENYLLDIY